MDREVMEGAIANAVALFRTAAASAATNMLYAARRAYKLGLSPEMESFIGNSEKARTEAYLAKMTTRLELALDSALMSNAPIDQKLEHWEKAIQKETTYVTAHIDAAGKRLERINELVDVYEKSPRGARWVLGDAKQHTPDCLAMGGKVWSWPVLLSVNPYNRHYGCKCHIAPISNRVPDSSINTFIPPAVILDTQEATTYQMAKKAFYAAKRGTKKAEYVALSQIEKDRRIRLQDAQLGGHFISKGGRPIFIPKSKSTVTDTRRVSFGNKPGNRLAKPVNSPLSRGTGTSVSLRKSGKTPSVEPQNSLIGPDGSDITPYEADQALKQLDYAVFTAKGMQAVYDAKFDLGNGRVAETKLYSFLDLTSPKLEYGRSDNPDDALVKGVVFVDNKAVGTFIRRIFVDKDTNEWIADHDYFAFEKPKLDKEGRLEGIDGTAKWEWATPEEIASLRGQGIATKFNRRAETFYRVIGIDRVQLFANKDVGGYAWARAGYSFDSGYDGKWILDQVNGGGLASEVRLANFDSKFQINKYVPGGLRVRYEEQVYDAVTPFDITEIGRDGPHWEYEGHDMWYGKALMMGSGWNGHKIVKPITDEELQAIEATQENDLNLSDFARELILASHGRHDMDEYMLSRIRAEVHYRWTMMLTEMEAAARKVALVSPAYAEKGKTAFNEHHLDIAARRELDDLFFGAVEKAISDFDYLLKASVPPES